MAKGKYNPALKKFAAELAILSVCWVRTARILLGAVLYKIQAFFYGATDEKGYLPNNNHLHDNELPNYEAAHIAKREWLRAVAYFDEVSEPDLVDYAAYSLQAAERKYMYLLGKVREEYDSPRRY